MREAICLIVLCSSLLAPCYLGASSGIRSERLEILSQGKEYAFFGKAIYQGKNLEIRADELRSRETEGALVARGHVRILRKSPKGEWLATGEKAHYNQKQGAGEMSGNVRVIRFPSTPQEKSHLLSSPPAGEDSGGGMSPPSSQGSSPSPARGEEVFSHKRPGEGEVFSHERPPEAVLLCDRLEIYDEGKRLMAFGNVRFAEEHLLGKAPRAQYREDFQEILLEGGASLEREVPGERHLLQAERMWIQLNSKQHRTEGKSRFRIFSRP